MYLHTALAHCTCVLYLHTALITVHKMFPFLPVLPMHTPLFSPKALQKHLDTLPEPLESVLLRAQEWKRMIDNRSVLAAKETELDGQFLTHFFRDILGFSDNRATGTWTLTKNQTSHADSSVPDGVLGFFAMQGNESVSRVYAVIELKDASHDLDKGQKRQNDKRTPVEQAFSYAPKAGGNCKWVIVSNYLELRLYHASDQSKYERFELSRLTEPDEIKRLLFLLHRDNLLPRSENEATSRTEELFAARVKEEARITKEFYAEYKQARNDLFKHLCAANPSAPELLVLNKTQKLLDRVIFVCFVEDKEIIPRRTFRRLLDDVKRDKFNRSDTKIWDRVRGLFAAINEGYPEEHINKFNGGLFADDAELDALVIKDSVLEHIIALEKYDFDSDLNVNILGHIFEQSITDIEELKAQIAGAAHDASKGKRKKDGIFYTPEYITRYIVQETVGGYLEERKVECGFEALPTITDADWQSIKRDKRNVLTYNKTIERHIAAWTAYREKLAAVKVCDPACGSGAFLNQVFDFLYAEGQRVNAELARLQLGQTTTGDLQKDILQNNIYGVDVNPESVEITRLSLWLKTADRSKELTSLDHTIRCGNSLVDDPNVAGETAFDWAAAFPEVMQQGGFDVIVGNPPYGAELREKEWLKIQYARTSFGNIDSYKYFVERAISLLRKSGNWGFILPDSYLAKDYFSDLRKLVVESASSIKNVKLGDGIFEDVNLPTAILLANKDIEAQEKQFLFRDLSNIEPLEKRIQELTEQSFEIYSTPDFQHTFMTKQSLINREGCVNLIDVYDQVMGVKVYQVGKGKPKQTKQDMDNDTFVSKTKLDKSYLPFISQGIQRYNYESQSEFIRYGEWLAEPREARYFTNPKIVVREIVNPRIYATYIEEAGVVKNIAAVIIAKTLDFDLKYLLALLNSQLFTYFLMTESPKSANQSYPSFSSRIVKELPIKQVALPDQQPFITHAETILTTTRTLADLRKRVLTLLLSKTGITKASTKLQEWDALTWLELEAEFRKAKVKLSLNDQEELLTYFEQKKAEAERLKATLQATDRAIDTLVYELYGLTAEEIAVVEGRG